MPDAIQNSSLRNPGDLPIKGAHSAVHMTGVRVSGQEAIADSLAGTRPGMASSAQKGAGPHWGQEELAHFVLFVSSFP